MTKGLHSAPTMFAMSPVRDAQGTLRGVLAASLDLAQLQPLLSAGLSSDEVITLVDADGVIAGRSKEGKTTNLFVKITPASLVEGGLSAFWTSVQPPSSRIAKSVSVGRATNTSESSSSSRSSSRPSPGSSCSTGGSGSSRSASSRRRS